MQSNTIEDVMTGNNFNHSQGRPSGKGTETGIYNNFEGGGGPPQKTNSVHLP
jgi:hypothetical protein